MKHIKQRKHHYKLSANRLVYLFIFLRFLYVCSLFLLQKLVKQKIHLSLSVFAAEISSKAETEHSAGSGKGEAKASQPPSQRSGRPMGRAKLSAPI